MITPLGEGRREVITPLGGRREVITTLGGGREVITHLGGGEEGGDHTPWGGRREVITPLGGGEEEVITPWTSVQNHNLGASAPHPTPPPSHTRFPPLLVAVKHLTATMAC